LSLRSNHWAAISERLRRLKLGFELNQYYRHRKCIAYKLHKY
jgi:hypothetical protein